jgi:uncharacterized protein
VGYHRWHPLVADNYLTFWFRFVLPNRSALEQGQTEYVWSEKITPALSAYMGPRFEAMCRQFIRLQAGRWQRPVAEMAVWWRADDELEIVGHDNGTVVLAAEAKWTNDRVGFDVLRTLQRRVALLPRVDPDCQLVLFAKAGFTPQVEQMQNPYLALYTLDDLFVP